MTLVGFDSAHASALEPVDQLVYRSRALGGDPTITNFGGGNTSAKIDAACPLTGEPVRVLWVKGSGGDLGSLRREDLAALYLDKVVGLERRYRGLAHEDEMVALYPFCAFGTGGVAASIDTPLHAFVPHRHVDHVHPDDVIAIAAASASREITRAVWDDQLGWLPWQRPGFELGLRLRDLAVSRPELRGVLLAGHGVITWGDTSEACYRNTLEIIRRATRFVEARSKGPAFGGPRRANLEAAARRDRASAMMPLLRGALGISAPQVGHFVDSASVLEFCASERCRELARLGTSCPDHFLRTKIRPLVVELEEVLDPERLCALLTAYRSDYAAYYDRHRVADSPAMRDPNPIVFLVPGVGMLTFARDKKTARLAAEFYQNAINVMRGATSIDTYVGLDEGEAFRIEYWQLEEAKLRRLPPAKLLAGTVALVTGAAGGIGRATAERLLVDDACVMLTDRDEAALASVQAELSARFGADRVRMQRLDVTREDEVVRAFQAVCVEFGGLDIVVSNAGAASSATAVETSLELWQRNLDVLCTGTFLVGREAMRLFIQQRRGGAFVLVGSKNAVAASPGAAAYCTAKAGAVHFARCLALEGAEHGVRVNVVNPDAVLAGSRIWDGAWRAERAATYGIAPDQLEDFYRKRSLLKRSVLPADVAEAIHFFASGRSNLSTANLLNVDAGHPGAFTR